MMMTWVGVGSAWIGYFFITGASAKKPEVIVGTLLQVLGLALVIIDGLILAP